MSYELPNEIYHNMRNQLDNTHDIFLKLHRGFLLSVEERTSLVNFYQEMQAIYDEMTIVFDD